MIQNLSIVYLYIYDTATRVGQIVRPSSGSLQIRTKKCDLQRGLSYEKHCNISNAAVKFSNSVVSPSLYTA